MYTAYWFRYPRGNKAEPIQCRDKDFDSLDAAIKFLRLRYEQTKPIYWAGAHIGDEVGDDCYIYEIASDGTECYSEQEIAI